MFANMNMAAQAPINSIMPVGSPQPSSIWGDVGGFLSQAVNTYGQFEAIKAAKNSTGQGRVEHTSTPELKNGAARLVDAPKVPQVPGSEPDETMVFGYPQKTVIMAFGGLLIIGLVLKGRK